MREKYLQLTKINKELKKRLDSEKIKATFAECLDCQMLKQDLIRIKEEADLMHEKYLEQKQKAAEESHQLKSQINQLQKGALKQKITIEDLCNEKQTIMKKLLYTNLFAEKHSQFESDSLMIKARGCLN